MAASRRALTIHLAREARTLLRAFEPAEPPRPTAPAPARAPLPPAIEAIARTLDEGSTDDVTRLLQGDRAADAGRALFQTLFGADADFLAILRDLTGDPSPDPRKHPLRVRVVTADPLFAGLPYRLTTRAGERLEDLGFTFEATHASALRPPPPHTWNHVFVLAEGMAAPEKLPSPMLWRPAPTALRDVRFPPRDTPPRVLVVATARTEAVRALREGLAAIGLPHDRPAFLRVVRAPEDLGRALSGMRPDVVHLLAELAPLALLHRTGAWSDMADPRVRRALLAALGAEGDPVAAIRDAGGPSTALVHAAHARWIRDDPPLPPSRSALALRRSLDDVRAEALARIEALALDPDARVLALIQPEPPRALGTSGARPLLDELEIAGRHLGRARALALPEVEGDDPLLAWKDGLRRGLDAEGTFEEALRKIALDAGWAPFGAGAPEPAPRAHPEDRASFADRRGERGLVWLDGGTRGDAPHRRIATAELHAWLTVAAEVLAPRCPPEIRVVWSIAIEMSEAQRARLDTWLGERRGALATAGFDAALLPGARALSRDEVRACLEDASPEPCPEALLDPVTDATLALATYAHATSWGAVLRGFDEPEPEEDEIF